MKIIKNLLAKLQIALLAVAYAGSLLADLPDNIKVGLDVLKTDYSTKDGYGRNIFAKNPMAFNVFVGYELPRNFFLEAGYETHDTKRRNATISAGDYDPGFTAPNTYWGLFNTKIKVTHSYLGAGMHAPFFANTDFFILAGLSVAKIKARIDKVASDTIFGPITFAANDIETSTFSKSKIAPMIKIGVSHAFTEHLAFRLTGVWHKLSFPCNVDSSTNTNRPYQIRLKNSYALGVGLSYSI